MGPRARRSPGAPAPYTSFFKRSTTPPDPTTHTQVLPDPVRDAAISTCVAYGVPDAFAARRELVNFKKVMQHLMREGMETESQLTRQSSLLHCPILEAEADVRTKDSSQNDCSQKDSSQGCATSSCEAEASCEATGPNSTSRNSAKKLEYLELAPSLMRCHGYVQALVDARSFTKELCRWASITTSIAKAMPVHR